MNTKARHALQLKFEELRHLRKENKAKLEIIRQQYVEIDRLATLCKDRKARLERLLFARVEDNHYDDFIEYRYRISKFTLKLLRDPQIAHTEAWRQVCENIGRARLDK